MINYLRCKISEPKRSPTENVGFYLRCFLCEFIGNFYFLFIGCSCVHKSRYTYWSYPAAIMGFIFVLVSCIQFMQFHSGHLNPSLTIGLYILGHNSIYKVIVLILGQLTGSTVGIYVLRHSGIMTNEDAKLCCTEPLQDSIAVAFVWEYLSSALLLTSVYSILDGAKRHGLDALPIKCTLMLIAVIYPVAEFTGCSMNPSRSLGPAIVNNCWKGFWIYMIAPLVASVTTAGAWVVLFVKDDGKPARKGSEESEETK